MKYLEWNNIISSHFFNEKNAGKDIHLYLSRNDIVHLSKSYFNEKTNDEIWEDFIRAIKSGLPGSNGNIIAKAKHAYSKRDLIRVDSIEIEHPPYITYLVFIVLPLIEGVDGTYSANNYYDRLNRFLTNNSINETISTIDFRNNQMNLLWDDLGSWANVKKNGDLGFFKVIPFANSKWVYVGKVFSQCVFPPKAIKRLPELFLQAGMIPNSNYLPTELKRYILNYGSSILQLSNNIIDAIRRSDTNELGESIIEIVNREYKKWTGETLDNDDEGATRTTRRSDIVTPLFLQFKVNENEESIHFSFRTYSQIDYPEDLKFGEYENLYEINGWSRTLTFDQISNNLMQFELKDDFNKWVARFPNREIRLFISAGSYQLSADYWIEAQLLSRTEPMYLLCRNASCESILEWGKSFRVGDFKAVELEGLTENFTLFKILNPVKSHPDFPILTLYTEKKIEVTRGLKVNFRTFINDFLPEIEIINSKGDENIFLQYKNTEEKTFLIKKNSSSIRWLLPDDTLLNIDFYIKVKGENFIGNEIAYNIVTSNDSSSKVDGLQLPKRDSFGRNSQIGSMQYCLGSNIINPTKSSQRFYSGLSWLFTSRKEELLSQLSLATINNHCGNRLCSFLTLKNVLTTEEFFRAFEYYYSKETFQRQVTESFNLTRTKKASLNFYDYLGILDYDYETKQIVVNPSQLIFIPSTKGRRVLLIGARDSSLVEKIIVIAPKYNLQVEISEQFSSNARLLLPDRIVIKAFGEKFENYGEKNLIEFAKELKINFSNDYFPQVALQDFSSGISGYENELRINNETSQEDYGWARKIFNPENLKYEIHEAPTFDKSFSLIEYKLNEYTYYNKLWIDGKCYQVDKNWGKYLALRRFKKNVILFDNKRVAIPTDMPLPRILSESIMLLSGLAPDFCNVDGRNYRVYGNIPSLFTENLFHKLGQQPIKKDLK